MSPGKILGDGAAAARQISRKLFLSRGRKNLQLIGKALDGAAPSLRRTGQKMLGNARWGGAG